MDGGRGSRRIYLYFIILHMPHLSPFQLHNHYHGKPPPLPMVPCTKSPHQRGHFVLSHHEIVRKRHYGYHPLFIQLHVCYSQGNCCHVAYICIVKSGIFFCTMLYKHHGTLATIDVYTDLSIFRWICINQQDQKAGLIFGDVEGGMQHHQSYLPHQWNIIQVNMVTVFILGCCCWRLPKGN